MTIKQRLDILYTELLFHLDFIQSIQIDKEMLQQNKDRIEEIKKEIIQIKLEQIKKDFSK